MGQYSHTKQCGHLHPRVCLVQEFIVDLDCSKTKCYSNSNNFLLTTSVLAPNVQFLSEWLRVVGYIYISSLSRSLWTLIMQER